MLYFEILCFITLLFPESESGVRLESKETIRVLGV